MNKKMKIQKYHKLENVYWKDKILCLTVNGNQYEISNILKISERLANASDQ